MDKLPDQVPVCDTSGGIAILPRASTHSSLFPYYTATAKLHLAFALPRRLALRLASVKAVEWAAENEHRAVEPPTRSWTLAGPVQPTL